MKLCYQESEKDVVAVSEYLLSYIAYTSVYSYTLLFSGALLCRITPPLCLNFLSVVHMDSHVFPSFSSATSYTRVMGHMDVVSIVQDGFNIYFPTLLLVLTLATYFSLGSRLLSFLGFQQFLDQEDATAEFVEEGRELVNRSGQRSNKYF